MLNAKKNRVRMLVATLSVLAVTACGNDDPADDDAGSETPSANAESGTEAAEADMAERLKTDVALPMPTEPVEMGDHKLAIINIGINSPYGVVMQQYFDDAAQASGWEYKQFDAQLDVNKVSGLMIQAVQEGYDAIIIGSTDVNNVAAATEEVLDAGIPLVCVSCASLGEFEGKVIDIRGDWQEQGRSIAAALVARSGEETKAIRFTEPAYYSVEQVSKAFADGVAEYCPSCDAVDVEPLPVQELVEPGPPTWSAFLSSNPAGTYTDAVAWADYPAQAMQATADQSGRDDISISSTASLADQVNNIKNGASTGVATVESQSFQAYAAVDLAARALAGLELWDATDLYSPLVDASNADKFLPDGDYKPDGQDFVAEFQSLWQ